MRRGLSRHDSECLIQARACGSAGDPLAIEEGFGLEGLGARAQQREQRALSERERPLRKSQVVCGDRATLRGHRELTFGRIEVRARTLLVETRLHARARQFGLGLRGLCPARRAQLARTRTGCERDRQLHAHRVSERLREIAALARHPHRELRRGAATRFHDRQARARHAGDRFQRFDPRVNAMCLRRISRRILLGQHRRRLADERGVGLSLLGEGVVQGDGLMIRRALSNLLSNAIRHTPAKGTVRVTIAGSDDAAVRVSVENPGPAIDAAHLPRLFDRFYRVDASRAQGSDGAGLGLAITKSIVDAHRGTIGVSSIDGCTRFEIGFPRAERSSAS